MGFSRGDSRLVEGFEFVAVQERGFLSCSGSRCPHRPCGVPELLVDISPGSSNGWRSEDQRYAAWDWDVFQMGKLRVFFFCVCP